MNLVQAWESWVRLFSLKLFHKLFVVYWAFGPINQQDFYENSYKIISPPKTDSTERV